MSEPVIRMEKIVKTYYVGKPNELEILHGIDLTVNQGEFVSIVGESGSGKSTLMNIIGVLDRQTSGSYYLEGQDVNGMTDEVRSAVRNRRIGFVFQNFNLLPRANALKNVMVPLIYGEEKTKNAKERAMEMLAMVGMDGRADHRPNELSGGQKQRVAIARAMINDPAIILADEPTGASIPFLQGNHSSHSVLRPRPLPRNCVQTARSDSRTAPRPPKSLPAGSLPETYPRTVHLHPVSETRLRGSYVRCC